MNDERMFCVAFSVFPGIGPVRFRLLREYFGSAKAAWGASPQDLRRIGLGESLALSFERFRRQFDASAYMETLAEQHIGVVTLGEPKYPRLLSEISDAPIVLYIKGRKDGEPLNLERTVAVVGTRQMSSYGKEVTARLVTGLVAAGCTIVSGMAYGIDAVAHATALEAGGKTIAVLGCGIDIIAPRRNARLYYAIAHGGGAVVSEMPLGLLPTRRMFPARNRIISGLSLGVIVTEGADDSGALITARYAAEQGRDVFAVPGPVTSVGSRGPFRLLRDGARLSVTAEDVLEELGISTQSGPSVRPVRMPPGQTPEERSVLRVLASGQIHIDRIVRATRLTMHVVAATLTVLEMKNIVKHYGEKVYGLL